MPSITLTEAFGAGATRSSASVTINFSSADFTGTNGLTSPATATPSQLIAALLQLWNSKTDWTNDSTKGIGPGFAQTKQQVTTRGTTSVNQLARPITINIYENDNQTTFDPDNTIA